MDGYRLPIKSCELPVNRRCVGEVCPSLLLEMALFACSGADMTGFLAAGTSDHSCTNNKKERISQTADRQLFLLFSTNSAVIVRLILTCRSPSLVHAGVRFLCWIFVVSEENFTVWFLEQHHTSLQQLLSCISSS